MRTSDEFEMDADDDPMFGNTADDDGAGRNGDDHPDASGAAAAGDEDEAGNGTTGNGNGVSHAADRASPPGGTVADGRRWVPLGELRLEHRYWQNPRRFSGLDKAGLEGLANSIKSRSTSEPVGDDTDPESDLVYAGIDDPLKVVQVLENGAVINLVIDGQRRICAIQTHGVLQPDALVPVIDLEPAPVVLTAELAAQYLLIALRTVGTRAGLSSFELAESAQRLRGCKNTDTGNEYTLLEIATEIGKSESWVSRMLKAMSQATPKVLLSWQEGSLTDEQFKDLSAQRDTAKQVEAAGKVLEAKKGGARGESRTIAKEQRELAKAAQPPRPAKHAKAAPSSPVKGAATAPKPAKGEQISMPATPPRKPPPFAVVEDLLQTAEKTPPTHDYVKGLLDGVRWDRGLLDAAMFAKPFHAYTGRVAGSSGSSASPAKPKASKPPKPAKKPAKRGRGAITR